ncbi:MAG: SOS response-associated peptidase [Acetatifactor sp.]|nr:SOS response-associated peptidase [Acetatifactor sp.]
MCGRYYIDDDVEKEIYRIAQEIDESMSVERTRDIYPTQEAPVLYGRGDRLHGGEMKWGLTGMDRKLLINARAETAMDRPTFSDCVRQRRCVIPARHFYEWDREKQKVTFYCRQRETMVLAGFYREQEDGPHFIILTIAANASVRPVHERMPLILEEEEIRSWIWDDSRVCSFLNKSSPLLERRQDYEQMSLF